MYNQAIFRSYVYQRLSFRMKSERKPIWKRESGLQQQHQLSGPLIKVLLLNFHEFFLINKAIWFNLSKFFFFFFFCSLNLFLNFIPNKGVVEEQYILFCICKLHKVYLVQQYVNITKQWRRNEDKVDFLTLNFTIRIRTDIINICFLLQDCNSLIEKLRKN
jgi:hypothetical protein